MATLVPLLRNKLEYPGGSPGFDPNHLAARGGKLSQTIAIAVAPTKGNEGATASGMIFPGSATDKWTYSANGSASQNIAGMDGLIGPRLAFTASTPQFWTSPMTAITPTATTNAAILTITGTQVANGCVNGYGGAGDFMGFDTSNHLVYYIGGSATAVSSGIVLTSGHSYFLAVSARNGLQNFVVRDLGNGQIKTATGASATALGINGTTSILIQNTGVPSGGLYNLAASMVNDAIFLGMAQLLYWADDPWSFWYPRTEFSTLNWLGTVAAAADVLQSQIVM